jgi:hypothetical protein
MSALLRGLVGIGLLTAGVAVGHYTTPPPGPAAAGPPAPRRWEATVLLPLADDQGRSFAGRAWQEALEALVATFGGAGGDVLSGGDGADVLFAGWGDNVVFGGAGDHVLDGGAGDDILLGNAGDDVLLNGEVVFDE